VCRHISKKMCVGVEPECDFMNTWTTVKAYAGMMIPEPGSIIEHPEGKDLAVISDAKLYIRKSYKDIHDIVIKAGQSKKPKILITGTSGYGTVNPLICLAKSVIAISPKAAKTRNFQEFDKDLIHRYHMPPWLEEELLACQKLVQPLLPEKLVVEIYEILGGIPRYVLKVPAKCIAEGGKIMSENILENAKAKATYCFVSTLSSLANVNMFLQCLRDHGEYMEISNHIIHRLPCPVTYEEGTIAWGSRHIELNVLKKWELQSWNKLLESFCNSSTPEGYKVISEKLFVPKNLNSELISHRFSPNCLFQVTVSETHPIMHHHLVNIVEHMPAYLQDKKTKIQFYFVVPEDKYDNFQYQKLETETRNEQNVKSTREIK
ncbi:5922_t:CDS:2, partial [Paraglomus brasilianum]